MLANCNQRVINFWAFGPQKVEYEDVVTAWPLGHKNNDKLLGPNGQKVVTYESDKMKYLIVVLLKVMNHLRYILES